MPCTECKTYRRMRGIKSHAMVLCASNADHSIVEFLVPPEGSVPGDRVFFEGHEGESCHFWFGWVPSRLSLTLL